MPIDVERGHHDIKDPVARQVLLVHEVCRHTQAGRGRRADVVEDGLVAPERAACPVLADRADEARLDGIPRRGTGVSCEVPTKTARSRPRVLEVADQLLLLRAIEAFP